jgi:hypothetical protein
MSETEERERALIWRKSSYSMGNGACAEATAIDGIITVRDSVAPVACHLQLSATAWRELVLRVKAGAALEYV